MGYSEPGKGSTFKVYLPVSEETLVEMKAGEKTVTELKGSETILLVGRPEPSVSKDGILQAWVVGSHPRIRSQLRSIDLGQFKGYLYPEKH